MFAIVGATGHVGFATAAALREAELPVRAIFRDRAKAPKLEAIGCEIAAADLQSASLADAIAGASDVQIIVPLRPNMEDPVEDMRRSIEAIVRAVSIARPARLLAISDYGAHVPQDIGMPSVFHDLEHRLARLEGRKLLLRSAEHMHTLARAIPAASASGSYVSVQGTAERPQPTIDAGDLGRIAAELWQGDWADDLQVVHAEGPARYSPTDVASVLSGLLARSIAVREVPLSAYREILKQNMPPSLADVMGRVAEAKLEGGLIDTDADDPTVRYGSTDLADALRPMIP